MRSLLLWLAVWCGACSGGGQSPPFDTAPGARCSAIQLQLEQAVADRGTCLTASDCEIVGGQLGPQTCDCAPAALDCAGTPIAHGAIGFPRISALIAELKTACALDCTSPGALACACDCAPLGPPVCNHGRCEASVQGQCLPGGVDGGI